MAVSMNKIAQEAGVSQATVSLVLSANPNSKYKVSQKTTEKVERIANQLGYKPNRMAMALKNKKTHMIGILQARFESRSSTSKLDGINKVIGAEYSCIAATHGFDGVIERKQLETFMECRLDGVIASWSGDPESIEIYREIKEEYGIPLVLLDRRIEGLDCPVVGTDHYNVSYKAIHSLIELGHKKIALITLGSQLSTDFDTFNGYHDAMLQFGNEEFIKFVKPDFKLNQHDTKELRKYADQVLDGWKQNYLGFTAFLAQGDLLAHALMDQACKSNIDIPNDLSLMGMGDLYASSLEMIRLSTVTEHLEDIGKKAANLLLSEMNGIHCKAQVFKMPVDVTIRRTTKSLL